MLRLVIVTLALGGVLCESLYPEEGDLFEGDMRLTSAQIYAAKHGLDVTTAGDARAAITYHRWPGATVVYDLDASVNNRKAWSAISAGMEEWSSKTCIRFRKRRPGETAYVNFFDGGGCDSDVGRTGGKQLVSLGPGCWQMSTVAHELGHTIGLFHEQSRPDRDAYVKIHWENISEKGKGNFHKYGRSTVDSLGEPYDYDSLMHYRAWAFSKNGEKTIEPLKEGVEIGQRWDLSPGDVKQVNKMYNC